MNRTQGRSELRKALRAILDVQQLTVIPPGDKHAALRMMSFRLEPGKALGVSGAGKSTLARALTAVWPAAGGKIRLDGAATDHSTSRMFLAPISVTCHSA
jgi:ATP-binding cassette, subfamily C, type I secretion system permease/ATPase